ncbi:MAG: c-type cytochrome [Xanthomonadaceae bacterium]|nr:c-type cytochrome [Xanthomonadaceae bacterium]
MSDTSDKAQKNTEEQIGRRDNFILLLVAVFFLLVTVVAIVKEYRSDWRDVQAEAKTLILEKFGPEAAAAVPTGIRQIWIPGLHDTVDRCTTCHLGVEWEGLEDAPQPFTTHPYPELLAAHPLKDFGCTSCHRGQGYAVETESAHGYVNSEEWPFMLLGRKVKDMYGLKNRYGAVEISCYNCHRYDQKVLKDLEMISLAKEVVNRTGCRGCHVIEGEGGNFAPKLNEIGHESGEHFNFKRLHEKHPSIMNWHLKHFENPQKVSATSFMTRMAMTPKEIKALSLLMFSWDEDEVPRKYMPSMVVKK